MLLVKSVHLFFPRSSIPSNGSHSVTLYPRRDTGAQKNGQSEFQFLLNKKIRKREKKKRAHKYFGA